MGRERGALIMTSLIQLSADGAFARLVAPGHDLFTPIPPTDGPTAQLYDALLSAGTDTEPLPVALLPAAAVSPLQIRRALRQAGLKDAVEAYVADLPEADRAAWEYATAIERSHPLIAAAATALSLSPEAVDELFALATSL
jgi:hypothetical protein